MKATEKLQADTLALVRILKARTGARLFAYIATMDHGLSSTVDFLRKMLTSNSHTTRCTIYLH